MYQLEPDIQGEADLVEEIARVVSLQSYRVYLPRITNVPKPVLVQRSLRSKLPGEQMLDWDTMSAFHIVLSMRAVPSYSVEVMLLPVRKSNF